MRFLDLLANRRGKVYDETLREIETLGRLCVSARAYTVLDSTAVRDNEFIAKLTAVRDVLVFLTSGEKYAQLTRYVRRSALSNLHVARAELEEFLKGNPITADKDQLDDLLYWISDLANISRHVLLGDKTFGQYFAT